MKRIYILFLVVVLFSCSHSPEYYYKTGILNYQNKKLDKALKCFEKSLEKDKTKTTPYYNIGLIYKNKNLYEKAIENWKKALEIDPSLTEAHLNIGLAYLELKKYDEAEKEFLIEKEINKDYKTFYNDLSKVYQKKGDLEKAEEQLKKEFEITPCANALNNLGTFYLQYKQDKNKTEEFFKKATELDPKNEIAWYNLSYIYWIDNKFDQAIEMAEKILSFNPNYQPIKNHLAEIYISKGTLGRLNAKYEESEINFKKALEYTNEPISIYERLAKLYLTSKEFTKGKEIWEKIIELKPNDEKYYIKFAQYYYGFEKTDLALEILKKGLTKIKNNSELLYNLATLNAHIKSFDEAIKYGKKLIKKEYKNPNYYRLVALFYIEKENFNEAEKLVLKAINLADKQKEMFYDTIGWVYYKKGDLKKAENYFTEAIKKIKNPYMLCSLHYHLSCVYKDLKKNDECISELKQALTMPLPKFEDFEKAYNLFKEINPEELKKFEQEQKQKQEQEQQKEQQQK